MTEVDPAVIACSPVSVFDLIRTSWHFLLFAMWGGLANYLASIRTGTRSVSISAAIGELLIAGFFGMLAGAAWIFYMVPDGSVLPFQRAWWGILAVVGITGHLGTRSAFLIWRLFKTRIAKATGLDDA